MKILSYPLSLIFGFVSFLVLLFYHPLHWMALKFGYHLYKKVADAAAWTLAKLLLLIGNTLTFIKHYSIPEDTTIIFVANHQSIFDIPPIMWKLRKYHPKFVSKIELGKGIPSVSFNLRHGGGALIDRKNPTQALKALEDFGKRIHDNRWAAVIFPEGTRSRNGQPKKFSVNGLKILARFNPEAYVVPISINNSWKVFKYGSFPLGLFNQIKIETHKPIALKNADINAVLSEMEFVIKKHIKV